jgi:hypothetical protein
VISSASIWSTHKNKKIYKGNVTLQTSRKFAIPLDEGYCTQLSFKLCSEAKLIVKSLLKDICKVDFYISCSAWSKIRCFMTADFNLPNAILKNKEIRSDRNSMGLNLLSKKTNSTMYLSISLQPFVETWPLFIFLIFFTVCRTPWTGDQPVARLLPTYRTAQTQSKRTHRHPCIKRGFEPTISVFERAKTAHASDRAATVIGTRTQLELLNRLVEK